VQGPPDQKRVRAPRSPEITLETPTICTLRYTARSIPGRPLRPNVSSYGAHSLRNMSPKPEFSTCSRDAGSGVFRARGHLACQHSQIRSLVCGLFPEHAHAIMDELRLGHRNFLREVAHRRSGRGLIQETASAPDFPGQETDA